ncbi:cyclase family protein [Mycobacterium sp. WUMAC-067]|uniref:cyclase family protein n=1 Tax=unclassified Mycobacterium TaxID=2642494 RepID=UPI001CD96EBC|nr:MULTISPECIES: cyclase family protein [unclassified Mycobacterium]MCA2245458.1 cyclase family protein [Mycobacterium sp. WUMAC-067]MCA2316984.1 cyclase family protein [Mycobacterium sp. WUMAC-025]
MAELPTDSQVGRYVEDLKNWGRWGPDDQLGTLNLIRPEQLAAAARLVTEGRTVSCARDLVTAYRHPDNCAQMYYVASGEGANRADGVPPTALGRGDLGSAVEFVGLVYHGTSVTHIDSLAHLFWKGRIYNDRSSALVTSEHGALFGAVTTMSDGIVGRGVLLDVPRAEGVAALDGGRAVTPDDLEATAAAQGVTVGPGDIVLLRTGRWNAEVHAPEATPSYTDPHDQARWGQRAGWHPACMPWLREREVAVIGCDGPQEALPPPYPTVESAMIHVHALYAMGMPLIDNCDLEQLSAVCAELGRWEFQFLVLPLRVVGGSGSPVNPVAVF